MKIFKIYGIVECGPGKYKGKTAATNPYCTVINQGTDACVTCPGKTVKTGYGNSQSLCVDVCDGTTNLTNSDNTACGELFKLDLFNQA